jgi:hypothetical protein
MPRRILSSESYPSTRPYSAPPTGRRRVAVPDQIQHYYVPLPVLEATDRVMRRCGRERRECYVWWGGYFLPDGKAQVMTAIWPDISTEFGHIHLDLDDLNAMHQQLRALDQVLVAELHSHPPGGGGQNEVDAANAAASYRGFISIVVPDFAAPRFHDLRATYVYEYLGDGAWRQLASREIGTRFIIEEPFRAVRVSK